MTSSPTATARGLRLPSSRSLPGPTASTRPRCGFSRAVSGSRMPPAVFSSASRGSTTTRSSNGRIFSLLAMSLSSRGLLGLHHAHATHATHPAHPATYAVVVVLVVLVLLVLLGDVGHARLGRQQQRRHGGAVLQGAARDLHRVDDAGLA